MTQLALGQWGEVPPDALRFRIGAVRVLVEIGETQYRVVSCSITYSDQGLPSAVINLPLGREIGSLAQEGAKPVFDPRVFKKFSKAKVLIEFGELALEDAKIGVANDAGQWVALDGFVSATEFRFSGAESAQVSIQILSNLASMSVANSAFGRFTMLHTYQSYIPLPTGAKGTNIPSQEMTEPDTWKLILGTMSYVLGANKIEEMTKAEGNASVRRLMSSLSPLSAAQAEKLRDSFISHTTLATDTMEESVKLNVFQNLQVMALTAVRAGQTEATMLNQMITLAQELNLRVVGLSKLAHVIPYWPTWNSSTIRVIPSGASFRSGLTMGEDVSSGTIAVGALVSSYSPGTDISLEAQKRMYQVYSGAYLIPNFQDYADHAVFLSANLPAYVGTLGVTVVPKDETDLKIPDDKKLQASSAPAAAAPAPDPNPAQDFTKSASLAKAFGRLSVYHNLFGTRTCTLLTALRQDIVPGCNIRVDNPIVNQDASTLSLVGYVRQVSINIDANTNMASTQYDLTHVRYLDEQTEIIDKEDEGVANMPFLWQDRTAEVNALTLWTAQ